MFRTRTREAMAGGVNFAGHYVVATWGCGTECESGHIVDARTGRAVLDLPVNTPFMSFQPTSRLFAVMAPADLGEMFGYGADVSIPIRYQSSYWVFEGDSLRFLGALVASDIEQILRGGPARALRTETPGDVLVPLTVGNTWTYARADGASTVTYRVVEQRTGTDEYDRPLSGVAVERVLRGAGGEQRTTEVWDGDGSLFIETAEGGFHGFDYSYGVPQAEAYYGQRVERQTVTVGGERRDAVCYVTGPTVEDPAISPSRTCFVPRIGMVSDDRDGAMTLTSYTLR